MLLITLGLLGTAVATTVPTVPEPTATALPCEKAPPHAQPADAMYRLRISGDPDLFLPGELYIVAIQGVNTGGGPSPFIGFKFWTEPVDDVVPIETTEFPVTNVSLGTLQPYDELSKHHEICNSTVNNATSHPKTDVQIIWTAPVRAPNSCVRLCAHVLPSKTNRSSVLARKICAAPTAPAVLPKQPNILEPCCACDEAKFEVTFESLWSRNTHPHEFPPESAQIHAHFGDVIGASHTARFRVWQEGRAATLGLRRLAEFGSTTALEKELKAESDHIRTIIKAKGITWQQITGSVIPNTFAVFRVDAKNHLVSLVSKLSPSPDWIVGVSALELCNQNCTWTSSASFPLYPFDAGTDEGITYLSRRHPTIPPAPVRALRPDWPNDTRSPFYSTTGEMRPFARLRLTRLQLFEKSCDAPKLNETGTSAAPSTAGEVDADSACITLPWSPWSPCSVTCGRGRTSRQRDYMWPDRARADGCRVSLTDHTTCNGPRLHCRAVSDYEPDAAETTGPCAMSPWSEWSPCEGCGVRARTRHYVVHRAHKRCHVGFRARAPLSQAMPCDDGLCYKPPIYKNWTTNDWFYADLPSWPCKVTTWGDWSPCSSSCGRGRRIRTRLYLHADLRAQAEMSRRLIYMWNKRFAEIQQLEIPYQNMTSPDPEVEEMVQDQMKKCQHTLSQQEALCDGDDRNCTQIGSPKDVCKLPMDVGYCRSYHERWFYDSDRGTCEPFGFTGCGGNANNFQYQYECQKFCNMTSENTTTTAVTFTTSPTVSQQEIPPTVTTMPPSEVMVKKLKAMLSSDDNEVPQRDDPLLYNYARWKCEMGPWLGWSDCFGECGSGGVKLNYRLVKSKFIITGGQCKKFVKSRNCKPILCSRLLRAKIRPKQELKTMQTAVVRPLTPPPTN